MNRTRILLLMAFVILVLCFTFFSALKHAHIAAREFSCRNNIQGIGYALLNYESAAHHLPLAIETKEGAWWRSWRTHIYPRFIEQMEEIYDPSVAWDSELNIRLLNETPLSLATDKGGERPRRMFTLSRVPRCFACPECSSEDGPGVNYIVVCGNETAFPRTATIKLSDISDGLENTIMVVESITCTPDWTEPCDLDIDTMKFTVNALDGPSISSRHPSGALVCFADGKVFLMTPEVTKEELRAMLTIAGHEKITRFQLIARGVLKVR